MDSVVHRTTDAALIKGVTPLTATLGDVITYTIDVPEPPISATLYNVTVTDELDARLQLHAVDAPGGTGAVTAGNAFTVTYADIVSLTQQTITVTAVVSDPLNAEAGDVITNVAILRHSTDVTTSNEVDTTVVEPLVSVTKTGSVLTGDPQRALYTLHWRTGQQPGAYSLVVTDALPAGHRATAALATAAQHTRWAHVSPGLSIMLDVGALQHTEPDLHGALSEAIYSDTIRFTNTVVVRTTSLTETIPGVRPYTDHGSHAPLAAGPAGRLRLVRLRLRRNARIAPRASLASATWSRPLRQRHRRVHHQHHHRIRRLLHLRAPAARITYTVRISETSYASSGPLAPYSQTLWTVGPTPPLTRTPPSRRPSTACPTPSPPRLTRSSPRI